VRKEIDREKIRKDTHRHVIDEKRKNPASSEVISVSRSASCELLCVKVLFGKRGRCRRREHLLIDKRTDHVRRLIKLLATH
jgi:hypothetical protein